MNKIEHDGIGTCSRIKTIQDADNAEVEVKWFRRSRSKTISESS